MPLNEAQRSLVWTIQSKNIDYVRRHFTHFPIEKFPIEFENEKSGYTTPLISSVFNKVPDITQLLVDLGANIYYVTSMGETALSTAYGSRNQAAIDFFAPKYIEHFGKDILLVEEVQGLIDNYYGPQNPRPDAIVWGYRDIMIPQLKRFRAQADNLSSEDIQFLQEKRNILQGMIRARDFKKAERDRQAAQISDLVARQKYIDDYNAACSAEEADENRRNHEHAALKVEVARLQKEAKEHKQALGSVEQGQQHLETRSKHLADDHAQLAKKVEVVEHKVEVLWDEHEAEDEVKDQQQHIRSEEPLRAFYDGLRRGINELFVGRQGARSKELENLDPTKKTRGATAVAASIPLPGATFIANAIGAVAGLYQKHQKTKRDKRVDVGVKELAADSSELNAEIVEPASRQLTLMGASQLRRFDKAQAEELADSAVRLMVIYIVYELPNNPQASYSALIQQLLMAVRVKRLEGVKIKDLNGETFKPKRLTTRDKQTLTESQVFAAFEHKTLNAGPRPLAVTAHAKAKCESGAAVAKAAIPAGFVASAVDLKTAGAMPKASTAAVVVKSAAAQAKASTPMLPASKPQPIPAGQLLERGASPASGLVLQAGRQQVGLSHTASSSMVRVS